MKKMTMRTGTRMPAATTGQVLGLRLAWTQSRPSPVRQKTTQATEKMSMNQDQTGPVLGILLAGVPLLAAVAIGAWRHARRSSTGGGLLLIVGTTLLWVGTVLGAFSVGLYILPAALLALVSLLACGLGRDRVSAMPA